MNLARILYPTDFSDANRPVLALASSLARQHGAELLISHVHEPPLPPAPLAGATGAVARTSAEEQRKKLLEVRPGDPDVQCAHRMLEGTPSEAILKLAKVDRVDLIVMGTHGRRALGRLLMGSVAEDVVREAPCPVMTLKLSEETSPPSNIRKILLPTDLSPRSNSAIGFASSLAHDLGAELILVHVEPSTIGYGGGEAYAMLEPASGELKARLDQLSPPHDDVRCSRYLLMGDPAHKIPSFAKEHHVDLILMTTHGRTGLRRLLMGSVAEAVVRRPPCAVLTLRQDISEDEDARESGSDDTRVESSQKRSD